MFGNGHAYIQVFVFSKLAYHLTKTCRSTDLLLFEPLQYFDRIAFSPAVGLANTFNKIN